MIIELFIKECAQTFKSIIYWLAVGILALFFFTQMGHGEIPVKPVPGQESYGHVKSTDKNDIMAATLGKLVSEYLDGSYQTYPVGFVKHVKPDEKDQEQIREVIEEMTGLKTKEEMDEAVRSAQGGEQIIFGNVSISPKAGLSFDTFKEKMAEIDKLLGGGSSYGEEYIWSNASAEKTYEQALEEYNELMEKDRLTGGYARLFCDYMGIVLAVVPMFLAVTRGLRDRRAKMQELIASRKASSAAVVVSRYLAMLAMLALPLLVLSCFTLAECIQYAHAEQISIDYLAFVKYILGWLMPTAMASAAVGLVLTELTDTALGVLVQTAWWFFSIFSGAAFLSGGHYGWNLVPRHNSIYGREVFEQGFTQLAMNRCFYVLFSVALVVLSVWFYSLKRKGRLDIRGKIFTNRKRKSEA